MTMRAAIYVRISRDKTGAGLGVDRQQADCEALLRDRGWTLVEVYDDNDMSAYSGKPRKGYLRMLEDIAAGLIDVVIAWHTDRLHRSPTELEAYIAVCEPRAVPTLTAKAGPLDLASPSGRMVARQLGAVARYEVEHMLERQRAARLQAIADGVYTGSRRPFGYEADGMTVREAEAKHVLAASNAVLAGRKLTNLAAELNEQGVTTSTGGPWGRSTLKEVLVRPRNAGLLVDREEIVGAAAWPAIVPEGTWRAVVNILTNPARRTTLSAARVWLGSGLYECGMPGCEGRMRGVRGSSNMRKRGGKPNYTCSITQHLVRNAEGVDNFVADTIVARLSKADAVDLLPADSGQDLAELHAQLLAVRQQLDEAAELYTGRSIDARQLGIITRDLNTEREGLEDRLAMASRRSALIGVIGAKDVRAAWEDLVLDEQRAIISTLTSVVILPARRGRPPGWRPGDGGYFDETTVDIRWRS